MFIYFPQLRNDFRIFVGGAAIALARRSYQLSAACRSHCPFLCAIERTLLALKPSVSARTSTRPFFFLSKSQSRWLRLAAMRFAADLLGVPRPSHWFNADRNYSRLCVRKTADWKRNLKTQSSRTQTHFCLQTLPWSNNQLFHNLKNWEVNHNLILESCEHQTSSFLFSFQDLT